MSREEAVRRTRAQLVTIIENPEIDVTQRVCAAGIVLKSYAREDEPTRLPGHLKSILRAVSDA